MRWVAIFLVFGVMALAANIFLWPVIPSTVMNMFIWPVVPDALVPPARSADYASRHEAFLYTQSNIGSRMQLPCAQFAADGHNAIILTFGQSNAGNHEEKKWVAGKHVANFNPADGKCYQAQDPMLGATGSEGSIWPVMGEDLIDGGQFQNVLIVPVAVGNSTIDDWRPVTRIFFPRLDRAIAALYAARLHVTEVIYQQGEMDAALGTPSGAYLGAAREIVSALRAKGVGAPIIMAVATGCGGRQFPAMKAVRSKVRMIGEDIFLGPDFGEVHNRYNGCHLFGPDAQKEASVLAEVVRQTHSAAYNKP